MGMPPRTMASMQSIFSEPTVEDVIVPERIMTRKAPKPTPIPDIKKATISHFLGDIPVCSLHTTLLPTKRIARPTFV